MKKIKQISFVLFIFSVLTFSYPVTQVFAQSINWNDSRQPDIGEEDKRHLQRFFVDRRIDRHTHIYVKAFNSCTGINFTLQSLRNSLTPARGTTIDETIESFMRHIGPPINLKACLCSSDIDSRILRGGLGCAVTSTDQANESSASVVETLRNERSIEETLRRAEEDLQSARARREIFSPEDKRHLQRFFVDRRVDWHTPIYVEAFNSCTPGLNFTLQSLRDSLTPARGTTVDDTIESFMRYLGSHRDNLKSCLCRSDIDIRILRGGLGCDETALAFRDAARRGEEVQKLMGNVLRNSSETQRAIIRNMK